MIVSETWGIGGGRSGGDAITAVQVLLLKV